MVKLSQQKPAMEFWRDSLGTGFSAAAKARANPVLIEAGFALFIFMWSHFLAGEPVSTPGGPGAYFA